MAVTCNRCGAKQGFLEKLNTDIGSDVYYCPSCSTAIAEERAAERRKHEEAERQRIERVKQAAKQVIVTTTPKVDGYYVAKYLGIESVEFVIGTGVFSEVSGSIADFFGARSSAFEKKLQVAKKHAMDALKFIAAEQGANAVVGVDLDYSEFSGNRIALIINGTLVKLSPLSSKRATEGDHA
jgi:uncharacterized protein YbjQ (UPF0145 family)